MRTTLKRVLGVAGLMLLTACGGNTSDGGSAAAPSPGATVKIGSIHPLSGALAASGQQMDKAVKLAVDDLNAAGGIKSMGGAHLAVDGADSQGKPDVAQSEAQRLIDGGAVALVGTYQSATATTVAQVAERAQVPFVIDVAVADEILSQGYKNTFRVQPNASAMGGYGAKYLKQLADKATTPIKTVAFIHEQSSFGKSVFTAFKAEADKQGFQVVKEVSYDAAKSSDYTPQLTEALSAKPDVLAVTGYYNDGLTIAKNLALLKPSLKAVFGVANGAFDAPQFPAAAAADGNSYLDVNYHYDAVSKKAQDLRARFKQKTGEEMKTEAVFAYQAVLVIADALERGKSGDAKKLRDSISKASLKTDLLPYPGPIQFDSKGENTNAAPIVNQVLKGEVVQVYPEKAQQSKPVFPGVPWQS